MTLLSENLPIREIDLARLTEEEIGVIKNHLSQLSTYGIITYYSIKADTPFSFYRSSPTFPDRDPDVYKYHKSYTQEIYDIIKDNPSSSFSIEQITDMLIQRNPGRNDLDRTSLSAACSRILSHLEKRGYVKKVKFGHNMQSEISLSPDQRIVLVDLVNIIENFQAQDPQFLEEGRIKARKIISDPDRVASLLVKARDNSPKANRDSSE